MSHKLFVGSLPWSTSDDALKSKFESFGAVLSAKVVKDRQTGRSKGFGFVEMENPGDAEQAIQALNGSDFEGRKIIVSEAKSKD